MDFRPGKKSNGSSVFEEYLSSLPLRPVQNPTSFLEIRHVGSRWQSFTNVCKAPSQDRIGNPARPVRNPQPLIICSGSYTWTSSTRVQKVNQD